MKYIKNIFHIIKLKCIKCGSNTCDSNICDEKSTNTRERTDI